MSLSFRCARKTMQDEALWQLHLVRMHFLQTYLFSFQTPTQATLTKPLFLSAPCVYTNKYVWHPCYRGEANLRAKSNTLLLGHKAILQSYETVPHMTVNGPVLSTVSRFGSQQNPPVLVRSRTPYFTEMMS